MERTFSMQQIGGKRRGRGRGSSATRRSQQVTALPSPSPSSERDSDNGIGFSIDNVMRLLSDSNPDVAKTAFQHTLDIAPIIRNLDENVAIRFWFAYYYFGLYENLGLTVDDWPEQFLLPGLEGRDSLLDRKLTSIKKIFQVWPNKFWAQLAHWGVRLPREPSGGTLSKLCQVASREALSVDAFAVQFLAWLPGDLVSRNEGKGGVQQLQSWRAGKRDVTEVDLSRFLEFKGDKAATEELPQKKDGATQAGPRKRGATSDLSAAKKRAKEKTSSSMSPSLDSVQGLDDELDELDELVGLSSPLPEPEKTNNKKLCPSKTGNREPSPLVVIQARSAGPREDGTIVFPTDMVTSAAREASLSTLSVAQRSTGITVPRAPTSSSRIIPAPQFTPVNAAPSNTTPALLNNATPAPPNDASSLPRINCKQCGWNCDKGQDLYRHIMGGNCMSNSTSASPKAPTLLPRNGIGFPSTCEQCDWVSFNEESIDSHVREGKCATIFSISRPMSNITVYTPTGPSMSRPELVKSGTAPTCPSMIPNVSGQNQSSSTPASTNLSPKPSNSVPSSARPSPKPSEIFPSPEKPTPAPSNTMSSPTLAPAGLLSNSLQTCSFLLSKLSTCKTRTLSARTRHTAAQNTIITANSACNVAITTNFVLRTGTTRERLQSFSKELSDQLAAKARTRGVYERTLADVKKDDPSAAPDVQGLIDVKIREIEGLTKQKEEAEDALANFGRAEIELEEAKKELDVAATAEKELLTELEEKVKRIEQSTEKRKKVAETLTEKANVLLDKAKEIEKGVEAEREFLAKAKHAIEQDKA